MKSFHLALTLTATATSFLASCAHADDKTEKSVAFRTTDTPNRYVTIVAKGGLNTLGSEVTARQTFVLVDLNGGDLADGDSVRIRWAPSGTKPTYWHESGSSVDRVGSKPDDSCTFKVAFKGKVEKEAPQPVVLQTASGKFVSVQSRTAPLALTDTQDKATTLEVVEIASADAAGPTTGTPVTPPVINAPTTMAPATAPVPAIAPATADVPAPAIAPDGDQKPTLFLIGDSTVNNGTPGLKGWGSVIGDYFDPTKIHVSNRARGGRSSRTFLTEGLWDKVLADVKPGDFVLMQFGHNDGGKPEGVYPNGRASLTGNGNQEREVETKPGQKEVVHTYGWYLRRYIADTKAKGATPVVLSLIPRNDWKDGHVSRANTNYGGWAKEAAQEGGALFVDLNALVADRYDALGQDAVKAFFPNEHTHTNEAGARLNAQSVVVGLKALPNNPLGADFSGMAP